MTHRDTGKPYYRGSSKSCDQTIFPLLTPTKEAKEDRCNRYLHTPPTETSRVCKSFLAPLFQGSFLVTSSIFYLPVVCEPKFSRPFQRGRSDYFHRGKSFILARIIITLERNFSFYPFCCCFLHS